MLTFVLILLIDFRLETSQKFPLPWPSCMILTYYRHKTYSRLSGMFRNPTIASNIIEVGQVVPEICHFLYFPWMTAAILDFGPYRCLKMCNLRFLFSSYTNEVKSITISLWASNHTGLWNPDTVVCTKVPLLIITRLNKITTWEWTPDCKRTSNIQVDILRVQPTLSMDMPPFWGIHKCFLNTSHGPLRNGGYINISTPWLEESLKLTVTQLPKQYAGRSPLLWCQRHVSIAKRRQSQSVGARTQSCLIPLRMSNGPDALRLNCAMPFMLVWKDSIMLCCLGGQPIFWRT